MNAKGKRLKRFKGVGKNLKAKIIASCRELWCSRGFSAEMDMGLNLVLLCWIPAVTWDEDKFHHCSSFIVFLPQTYLWKCHKIVLPNALSFRKYDIQQLRRNYYFFPIPQPLGTRSALKGLKYQHISVVLGFTHKHSAKQFRSIAHINCLSSSLWGCGLLFYAKSPVIKFDISAWIKYVVGGGAGGDVEWKVFSPRLFCHMETVTK